jgi:hypothetical protein
LARNFGLMVGQARQALESRSRDKPSIDRSDVATRAKVRDQLNRYAQMIQDGDNRALYYLQSLRGDLERLQAYRPKDAEAWLGETAHAIDGAGTQLRANAPEAARKLRAMADKLNAVVQDAAAHVSSASGSTRDDAPAGRAEATPEARP